MVAVIACFYFIICAVILDSKSWQLMGMWSKYLSNAKCLEWPKGSLGLNYEIDKCVLFSSSAPTPGSGYLPRNLATIALTLPLWLSQEPHSWATSGFCAFIHRRECAFFLFYFGFCHVICLKILLKLLVKKVLWVHILLFPFYFKHEGTWK